MLLNLSAEFTEFTPNIFRLSKSGAFFGNILVVIESRSNVSSVLVVFHKVYYHYRLFGIVY
jgi:hypothetical protein